MNAQTPPKVLNEEKIKTEIFEIPDNWHAGTPWQAYSLQEQKRTPGDSCNETPGWGSAFYNWPHGKPWRAVFASPWDKGKI